MITNSKSQPRHATAALKSVSLRKLLPGVVVLFCSAIVLPAPSLRAQISLTTAIDLALKSSPRVKIAQADVDKARAGLAETKDIYIPAINAGAGLGNSYGYSSNPPSLFNVTAGSLVYNAAQRDVIRAAHASLDAATLALRDIQESVAEDTALAFLALNHDQDRIVVLDEETRLTDRLVQIVQDRFDAGDDTKLELLNAKRTNAQFHLGRLTTNDNLEDDRQHLARLIGLPPTSLTVERTLPPVPSADLLTLSEQSPLPPSVASAFANAHAKQEIAFADNRFLYRPQFQLFLQFTRYATFASSFQTLQNIYATNTNGAKIGANEEAFGIQVSLPLFDKYRQARGRESLADAAHARHEAENAQFLALDGRSRLRHSLDELQLRTDIASLDQQYAQTQLDILLLQLNVPPANGPATTPKDEQNSRIAERERYLGVLDTTFQLHQTQINLLRQSGRLTDWLNSLASAPPTP